MEIMDLVKAVSSAVADAKTKDAAAVSAHQTLEAVRTKAQATFDEAVNAATKAAADAQAASRDAQVAGMRLRAQLNEALGGAFAPVDSRVRMG